MKPLHFHWSSTADEVTKLYQVLFDFSTKKGNVSVIQLPEALNTNKTKKNRNAFHSCFILDYLFFTLGYFDFALRTFNMASNPSQRGSAREYGKGHSTLP
jgi:hypothetical protein